MSGVTRKVHFNLIANIFDLIDTHIEMLVIVFNGCWGFSVSPKDFLKDDIPNVTQKFGLDGIESSPRFDDRKRGSYWQYIVALLLKYGANQENIG
jgi:hypothetical protein